MIDAVANDNPQRDVYVTDRGDYVHIHTPMDCRLTRASLERSLGRDYDLSMLEIEMPSFAGACRPATTSTGGTSRPETLPDSAPPVRPKSLLANMRDGHWVDQAIAALEAAS